MEAMTIQIVDWYQRPAVLARTSMSVSLRDCWAKLSVSERERPMVWPSMIPLTDSDSCTIEERSANCRCRSRVMTRRSSPTWRLTQTKAGRMIIDAIVSRQSSTAMAVVVAMTIVTSETSAVAVVVTVTCIPPMSWAMRDCTSPVRVRVKKASDMRWRWPYTEVRRSCMTSWPTLAETWVCQTLNELVEIETTIMPRASSDSSPVLPCGSAVSMISRIRNGLTRETRDEPATRNATNSRLLRYGRNSPRMRRFCTGR